MSVYKNGLVFDRHPFAMNAIVTALLHTGADWRAAVETLREMRNHGEEYVDAVDALSLYGATYERGLASNPTQRSQGER